MWPCQISVGVLCRGHARAWRHHLGGPAALGHCCSSGILCDFRMSDHMRHSELIKGWSFTVIGSYFAKVLCMYNDDQLPNSIDRTSRGSIWPSSSRTCL